MNLLPAGGSADYIVTGVVGTEGGQGSEEGRRGEDRGDRPRPRTSRALPRQEELTLDPNAAYVHMTSNNTIFGTEFHWLPETGSVPLVSDMSSDIFSRPFDVAKHALIYAGAQKNLAPAGVTLVDHPRGHAEAVAGVAAHDAQLRGARREPVALQHAAGVRDLRDAPGDDVAAEERRARGDGRVATQRKAGKLYAEIDRTGYYRGHAHKDCRSRMNVTFRLPSEDLEKKFAKEATAAGLDGLKGHRSVGGMRASIYNAFPEAGVDALVEFMKEFERKNG